MKSTSTTKMLLASAVAGLTLATTPAAHAVDAAAAEKLARQEGCLRCHGIDRAKDGPSYKELAAKLKSKPDAEAKVIKHLSGGVRVKFEDGHEEDHKVPKTKDPEQIKNLVQWILSQ
jgi:cytochrome c